MPIAVHVRGDPVLNIYVIVRVHLGELNIQGIGFLIVLYLLSCDPTGVAAQSCRLSPKPPHDFFLRSTHVVSDIADYATERAYFEVVMPGIVTWCSPCLESLMWLPVCLVTSYPSRRNRADSC